MNHPSRLRLFAYLLVTTSALAPALHAADIQAGDKVQTLTNLHPDNARRVLYTVNYQQPGLIPVCSDIAVKKINAKQMTFDYQGVEYRIEYEKNTKGAGIAFQTALQSAFGPKCDQAKIKKLGPLDQEGIKSGRPRVGMTRDGIYFAMGRPPQHANPSLDASYWLYWEGRFNRVEIEFDSKGKVSNVKH